MTKDSAAIKIVVRVRPPYVVIRKDNGAETNVPEYLDQDGKWWAISDTCRLPVLCYHRYITSDWDTPSLNDGVIEGELALNDKIAELVKRLVALEASYLADWPSPQDSHNTTHDRLTLKFIYNRLVNVHNELPNMDYMLIFKSIIDKMT